MKVGVIIPAYNEAERIRQTIRAVRLLPNIAEIVVVDDGSADETASEALREGARVVWHQANYGKGQALKTGIQSVRSEVIVFADADMGEYASDLYKLIEPIVSGKADMTVLRMKRHRKHCVKVLGWSGIKRTMGKAKR